MKIGDGIYAYPWEIYTENNCNSYLIDGPVRTLIDPGHLHLAARPRDPPAPGWLLA